MEVVLSIVFLIVVGVITFIDWSNPDKPAESLHPSDLHTVKANNERKQKQILSLKNRVDFLNAKHPDKIFYRDGAIVKERSGATVPNTKGFDKNTGDGYLAKHELPHLLSSLLEGLGSHEMFWSRDEQYIIFKLDEIFQEEKDYAKLTGELLNGLKFGKDEYAGERLMKWVKQLIIRQIEVDEATMRPQVAIKPSNSLLEDEDYLRMEVENHGRVFIRNTGNKHRWLIGFPNKTENTIEKGARGWVIQLSTWHYKPTVLNIFDDYNSKKMKREQMIESIESRFWKRKRVESFTEDGGVARLRVT